MKKNIILKSFAIISASLLLLTSCGNKTDKPSNSNSTAAEGAATTSKIAYIDLDSLETQYKYIVEHKDKFEAEKATMEAELKKLESSIQGQYINLKKKVDERTISQEEYEQTGAKIQSMEQNYQQRAQEMSNTFMAKTQEFQLAYRQKIDRFIADFNKDNKYDFILTYQDGGSVVLYANKALDITAEVVKGLNDDYQKNGVTPAKADTTKK